MCICFAIVDNAGTILRAREDHERYSAMWGRRGVESGVTSGLHASGCASGGGRPGAVETGPVYLYPACGTGTGGGCGWLAPRAEGVSGKGINR